MKFIPAPIELRATSRLVSPTSIPRKKSRFLPSRSASALLAMLAGVALLASTAQTARAAVIFTDPFATNASNWAIDSGGTLATWVSSGGPKGVGDGYITRTSPGAAGVIFRGQDSFDSSADGFVRNWLSAGVATFSIDILQDSGSVLNFGLRFASSANSPGASTFNYAVPSGVWTTISVPIANSVGAGGTFQTYEGPGTAAQFNAIFSAIGNVQISLASLPVAPANISMDNPTISSVPEPTSLALLGMTGVGGLFVRRRRS